MAGLAALLQPPRAARASLAQLLKYNAEQARASDGRFSGAGDETGKGAPQPGEKFVVYRLGDKNESLANRNAGNANAVAQHILRTQDPGAPQGKGGSGTHVTAHEVTVGPKGLGKYALFNASQGTAGSQVGRATGDGTKASHVTYSFPKGADFTSRQIGSVPLKSFSSFDDIGTKAGADEIRTKLSGPQKFDLGALLKYNPDQPRDANGRFGAGDGAVGRVDSSKFPRAEPGSLTSSQRAVETRFANQLAHSIPDAKAAYARLTNSKGENETLGGKLLNTDVVRELSADYRGDRASLSPAVHEPASEFTKMMYADKLAEPKISGNVLFTAGGAGSGKSSGISNVPAMQALQDHADVIYDTNMNKFGSAVTKIDQALASGRDVHIAYVARDPVESLTHGALPRAMGSGGGRTVPLSEHIATHVGAANTIQQLAAHYASDPRVQIHYIDNTKGRNGATLVGPELPKTINTTNLSERLHTALKAEHDAGRISTRVYEGTKGSHSPHHP